MASVSMSHSHKRASPCPDVNRNVVVNIYSHLIGGVLFAILLFYLGDIVVFLTFFFGMAVCFFLSAFFYTFANHSKRVAALSNQLDYIGVVVLMWGSTIPSKLYWSVVSVLATACIAMTLNPRFRHPQLWPYWAAMYSGLGLSAIVFIIYRLMGLMGALNLIGAAAYAARIPERWYPLKHDIYGSSHQILHFIVIFARLTYIIGLLSAFNYLHTQISPCI
ncbi:hemolysin-III related-domain-containing protein [Halenospora varia]|nr:hemolysin-III related-domain-containing protein [Halenospora varia]